MSMGERNIYVYNCSSAANSKINCVKTFERISAFVDTPTILSGKQRSNGDVVFAWAYNAGKFGISTLSNNKLDLVSVYTGMYDYSSVVIGQNKVFFVMKKYNQIQVVDDK
jgi:hypothetical protein